MATLQGTVQICDWRALGRNVSSKALIENQDLVSKATGKLEAAIPWKHNQEEKCWLYGVVFAIKSETLK